MSNNFKFTIKRLLSYLIDWYIYSFILISFNTLYSNIMGIEVTYFMTLEKYDLKTALIVFIFMLSIHFIYFVIISKLFNGQSIGKRLTKLRIVSKDGKNVKIWQLIIREFLGIILLECYISPIGSYLRVLLAMNINEIKYVTTAWYFITGFSILLVYVSKNKRMIHDVISMTKVVYL